MNVMYPLNKLIPGLILMVIFVGCDDDSSPDNGIMDIGCGTLVSVDGECRCWENTFRSPFVGSDGDWCLPLTDSFYTRIGYEGDITNFEIMSVLKAPSDKPTDPFYDRVTSEFPSKFIIELFPSNTTNVFTEKYKSPYISVIMTNENADSMDFPIVGRKELGSPPIKYRGPKDRSDLFYGVRYEWEVQFKEDSATVYLDVYSTSEDDSLFLDDEITMYFERYRE